MTCIVGVADGEHVYFGADSQITKGNLLVDSDMPKIWSVSTVMFGVSGSCRPMTVLKYALKLPKHYDNIDDDAYVSLSLMSVVKNLFDKVGMTTTKDGEVKQDSDIMVGYNGKIYLIGVDYAVIRTSNNYYAIGSGVEAAMGSLYTTERIIELKPHGRLELALEAASTHTRGVGGTFTYLSV